MVEQVAFILGFYNLKRNSRSNRERATAKEGASVDKMGVWVRSFMENINELQPNRTLILAGAVLDPMRSSTAEHPERLPAKKVLQVNGAKEPKGQRKRPNSCLCRRRTHQTGQRVHERKLTGNGRRE